MKIFLYDGISSTLELNCPEILLTKEFAKLIEDDRNKCSEDKKGKLKIKAFKEFTYMFLMIDWESPYADYSEQEKHVEALADSRLTNEEFDDEVFRAACRKYREIQESSREMKLVKAAQLTVDKLIIYMNNLDLDERDGNGKPIFKANDVMKELSSISTVIDALKTVEEQVRKDRDSTPEYRSNVEVGYENAAVANNIRMAEDNDDF